MAENSENIEARLCAYVEGDLDPAGRVEIEKHLEQHPNHRRLLAELTATRDLLRHLPREQAPSELAEAFNAQLERSELLDGPVAEANSTDIRGNVLPRLFAMAAIVVLTAGLGAVVYFALPQGGSRSLLAIDPATQPTTDGDIPAPALVPAEAEAPTRVAGGVPTATPPGPTTDGALARAGGGERMSKAGGPSGSPLGTALPEAVENVAPRPDADAIAFADAKAGQPAGGPVYVIVTAGDKTQAVEEAKTLLADNRIAWTPAPDEAIPLAQSQGQLSQALPPHQAQVAQAEAVQQEVQTQAPAFQHQQQQRQASTYAQYALNDALVKKQQRLGQVRAPGEAKAMAESGASPAPEDASKHKDEAEGATADRAVAARRSPAAVQPSLGDASQGVANAPGAAADAAAEPAPPQTQPPAFPYADADLALRADVSAIKARMTRAQVKEISRALNRGSQQVELIADHPQLQLDNESLQAEQRHAKPFAADRDLAVSGGGFGGPFARGTAGPSPSPALAPQGAASATSPGSPINMKAGSGPATRPAAVQTAVASAASPARESSPAPAGVASRERQMQQQMQQQMQMRQGPGPGARPERIRAGEKLNVTIDELAGPGVDRTAVAEVGPDGTIGLPKLNDPLRVEGLTRAQAESAIADAYKRSAGFDQATVRVEPADAPLANAARPAPAQAPTPPAAAPAAPPEVAESGRGGVGPRAEASAEQVAGGAGQPRAQQQMQMQQRLEQTRQPATLAAKQAPRNDTFAASVVPADADPTTRVAEASPTTRPTDPADSEPVEVVILVQANAAPAELAAPAQSQPAPVAADEVVPSDEADVQPAQPPGIDDAAPDDAAAPNSAAEPNAPRNPPGSLSPPNE